MSNEKLEQAADKFKDAIADLSDEAKAEAGQKFREVTLNLMVDKMTKLQVIRVAIASWLFGLADAIDDFAAWVEGDIPLIEIGAEKIASDSEDDPEETFIL